MKLLFSLLADVQAIISGHDGVTVYAGGDDVLALLPVPKALACAEKLADCYKSAFQNNANGSSSDSDSDCVPSTLSAAIVFAHIRLPLRSVLSEATRLLDDEAKDGNDRDSLAVGVYKPGGLTSQWVTKWNKTQTVTNSAASKRKPSVSVEPSKLEVPVSQDSVSQVPVSQNSESQDSVSQNSSVKSLEKLVIKLTESNSDPGFSSSLIYRIREALSLMSGQDHWEPGKQIVMPIDIDIEKFLHAEILRSIAISGLSKNTSSSQLEQSIGGQLNQSDKERVQTAEWTELVTSVISSKQTSDVVSFDALLLAHFLADPDKEGTEL